MRSSRWISRSLLVAASILLSFPLRAQFDPELIVTSSPDPNRVEPGVTTLTVTATAPPANWPGWSIPDQVGSGKFRIALYFSGTAFPNGQKVALSPEKTFTPGVGTLTAKFLVPKGTRLGHCGVYGEEQWLDIQPDVDRQWSNGSLDWFCSDVVPPKLHRGPGPVGQGAPKPMISPPPVQRPPEEQPRPERRSEPSASGERAAASMREGRALRSGERFELQDGRALTMRGSNLVLLGPSGEVLRRYPPGSKAVVGRRAQVNVRAGSVSEGIGPLRQ